MEQLERTFKEDVRWKEWPDTDYFTGEDINLLRDIADSERKDRIYRFGGKPEEQLKCIAREVKIHIKLSKLEPFAVWELLYEARELAKGKFQQWIAENFDFSYDTACNFIRVYECCFGMRS